MPLRMCEEEPVVLTLSSDEEENEPKENSSSIFMPLKINPKEPCISKEFDDNKHLEIYNPIQGVDENSEIKDKNVGNSNFIGLQCRDIRIGSYKVAPVDRIIISYEYIKITVPSCSKKKENITLEIPIKSIVKILANFNSSNPIVFLYMREKYGEIVRNSLGIQDKSSFYYDPTSSEECHKRITILPEKLKRENINLLRVILNFKIKNNLDNTEIPLLEELSEKDANEILVRSSPVECDISVDAKNAIASRGSEMCLIYPPRPNKGGITITVDDYCCLQEEEFLNDVLIDFYLKWLHINELSEVDRERTHVFSSFFYRRLTYKQNLGKKVTKSSKVPPAVRRHDRVKSWTKNVDIFSKDFLIIPVNEHSHWFLVVVCFPGLERPVKVSDGSAVPYSQVRAVSTPKKEKQKPKEKIPLIDDVKDDETSERDEATGDESELDVDVENNNNNLCENEDLAPNLRGKNKEKEDEIAVSGGKDDGDNENKENLSDGKKKKEKLSVKDEKDSMDFSEKLESNLRSKSGTEEECLQDSIKQPCIIVLDSLSGARRAHIVSTLRGYLEVEFLQRKKIARKFDKETMPGAIPKVPQQMNYSDCGLFTLQYAESFFKKPIEDFRLPIKSAENWFNQTEIGCKRETVAFLIRALMEEHNPKNEIVLPNIFQAGKDSVSEGSKKGSNFSGYSGSSTDSEGSKKSNKLRRKKICKRKRNNDSNKKEKLDNDIETLHDDTNSDSGDTDDAISKPDCDSDGNPVAVINPPVSEIFRPKRKAIRLNINSGKFILKSELNQMAENKEKSIQEKNNGNIEKLVEKKEKNGENEGKNANKNAQKSLKNSRGSSSENSENENKDIDLLDVNDFILNPDLKNKKRPKKVQSSNNLTSSDRIETDSIARTFTLFKKAVRSRDIANQSCEKSSPALSQNELKSNSTTPEKKISKLSLNQNKAEKCSERPLNLHNSLKLLSDIYSSSSESEIEPIFPTLGKKLKLNS